MRKVLQIFALLLVGTFFQPPFPVAHAGGGGPGCQGFFCQAAESWRSAVLAGRDVGNEVTNRWMQSIMNIPLPAGAFEWTTLGNVLAPVLKNRTVGRGLEIAGQTGLAVPLQHLQAAGRMAGPALQYGRAAAELAAGETAIVRNAITGAVQKVAMGEAGAVFGGRALKDAPTMAEALPVRPQYVPELRAAGSWANRGERRIWNEISNRADVIAENSAIPHGDLIRAVNYNRTSEVFTALKRMRETGPQNFVVVGKGSRYELRVAPQAGAMPYLGATGREAGVKHIQIAGGAPILGGGTLRVGVRTDGGYFLKLVTDTGTYGPHMAMTGERSAALIDTMYEAFHYQISRENILLEAFTPR